MAAAANKVNAAVQKGDKKAAGEQLKIVFGQCKGCHDLYRSE
jgi:cytochrome c556